MSSLLFMQPRIGVLSIKKHIYKPYRGLFKVSGLTMILFLPAAMT